MAWYLILLIVIASLLLFLFLSSTGVCSYFVHLLTHPIRYERDFCLKTDLDKKVIDEEVLTWKKEDCPISLKDGYTLQGDYYPGTGKGMVIFAHGYTWTREGSLKYAKLFHALGYSLYLYDERGHGDNKRTKVTLGYKESEDLHQVVQYFRKKYGKDWKIGLHGESMGGATVLLEMKHQEDDLSFVVADSPFASMKELMRYQITKYHLPSFLADSCSPLLKLTCGFSYKDVEPIESVRQSKVPLLLIQGDKDTFIPPNHTKEIYEARKERTTLHCFPNVDHTDSYHSYPKEYEETEKSFLEENGLF
ncbi:MAG: alpha/beta hydrolase [Eubacteriales bacterium]|nr:alpha/beta hydrolase [Eubacteriales bacterium]